VAQRSGARGIIASVIAFLKTDHRGKFIVLTILTAVALACAINAWMEPFPFRVHRMTDRAIVCNTPFSIASEEQKRAAIYSARLNAPHVFVNEPQKLVQLREALWNTIAALIRESSYDELDEQNKLTWLEFLRPAGQESIPESIDVQAAFAAFAASFKDDNHLDGLRLGLEYAFTPFEVHGVLMRLPFGPERGNQEKVLVSLAQSTHDRPATDRTVEHRVSDILFRDGQTLRDALRDEMNNPVLGDQLFNWIFHKFPETLREDLAATTKVIDDAASAVEDVYVEYLPGQLLVSAGVLLQPNDIALLRAEYETSLQKRTKTQRFCRFLAVSSVFALILVMMITLVFRVERRRPRTPHGFFNLMLGMIATVATAQWVPQSLTISAEWEILPLMLFVMLISIVYSWELAAILSIFLSIVIVSGNGGSVHLFITLLGVAMATAVQLGRLRSRNKLVIVGAISGAAVFLLTVAQGIQGDRPCNLQLCSDATINFCWAFLAGVLMTGLVPFIEKRFDILTDMSLLELGDVSHPLLQTLIKAAPATYGHSIQVGAIAETAAEAIHARGLLTRVGAYFHDVGKIMKPEYFSENQVSSANVHDVIEPQISTIVLVAHVKDGVDLARQYHLPKPVIDLIEQHHGTSLASFFYGRATKGGTEEVEESTYRYPGPKPKTKEAAILMIADTCESACRSMGVGIPPNKIEGKVHALIKQKLDDGQFDDSGLTLNELKIVEKSVIGSIIAAMHGRIQYPEGAGKNGQHVQG